MGFLSMAAFKSWTSSMVSFATQIDDTSMRLGLTTAEMQSLEYATRQNSGSMEALTSSLERLGDARDRIINGDDDLLRSFESMGITADKVLSLSNFDLLSAISQNIKGKNPESFIGPLRRLMGESAGRLIPTLKSGIGPDVIEQGKKSGVIASDEDLKAWRKLGDEWTAFKRRAAVISAPTASIFEKVLNTLGVGISQYSALKRGYREGRPIPELMEQVHEIGMANDLRRKKASLDSMNAYRENYSNIGLIRDRYQSFIDSRTQKDESETLLRDIKNATEETAREVKDKGIF